MVLVYDPVMAWWLCGNCSWSDAAVQRESVCPGSTKDKPLLHCAGTPVPSEFLLGTQQAKCRFYVQVPLKWARYQREKTAAY